MSIWVSHEDVGHDTWTDGHEIRGGDVRSYATGWSNHYPTTDDTVEQPARVGISSLPYYCVPGWSNDNGASLDEHAVGPWVRLDVSSHEHVNGNPTGLSTYAAVVMDEAAARQLAADLLAWADTPKVTPPLTPNDTDVILRGVTRQGV